MRISDWSSDVCSSDLCAEVETMTYLGGACPRAPAWRLWCTLAGAWHIRGFSMFSVIERATGEWVGRLGPWQPDGWPGPEIAYGVRAKFAGRGYAFEGAVAARSEERRGGKEGVSPVKLRWVPVLSKKKNQLNNLSYITR